jgi:hypothetical protein
MRFAPYKKPFRLDEMRRAGAKKTRNSKNTIYWMRDEERPRLFARRTNRTLSKKRKGVTKSCANLSCFTWSQFRESNSGPLLYESIALPAELNWQKDTPTRVGASSRVRTLIPPSFVFRTWVGGRAVARPFREHLFSRESSHARWSG